ncbi:CHASE2 domain-containing protein [Thiorhodospira sibirica]|uniref:CHASE2 domain-containing protein n=1 Tax=Thiorhodospira sibirica TaxID=154347 RepID=UPI001FEAA99E|nr:adenylate/guanylate cyclase domain-containing protein [Thiorhodospira sibirica]
MWKIAALSRSRARHLARILGVLGVCGVILLPSGGGSGFDELYQRLQLMAYDQTLHGLPPPSLRASVPPLVIVDIDELSLQREGHWPWPRERLATLLMHLQAAEVALVVFDILFAEAQHNPVDQIRAHLKDSSLQQALDGLRPQLDQERIFSEALARQPTVLGYVFRPQDQISPIGQLPSPLHTEPPLEGLRLSISPMQSYSAPLPILMQAAGSAGFFSLHPDRDGVIRRVPLLALYEGQLYPSLAVETVRQYLFLEQLRLYTETIQGFDALRSVQLDLDVNIPTDGQGQMLVPYRGPFGHFPYVSAAHVLAGEVDPHMLAGAIVLVGTTAPGLFDLRTIPLQAAYPGVEIQANVLTAILGEAYLVQPSWAPGAQNVYFLMAGLLLALLLPSLSVVWQLALAVCVGLVIVGLNTALWIWHGLVLDSAGPLLLMAVLLVFNMGWGFFFETRTRQRLKNMFGQYVPPALVEHMSERPGQFGFAGQSRELTVLFADIRGFTQLSEQLRADALKQFLNQYFTPMTRIIFAQQGTIDKYVGDMIMAFWGAPVNDPEHAHHAIEAALEMLNETQRLSQSFIRKGWPQVRIGVGINTGLMNVGDMGSQYRRAYTVLGDAVNLASRLESASKQYGVALLVGERTHALTQSHFLWQEVDWVRVKGKQHAVRIYQPLCSIAKATPAQHAQVQQFQQFLHALRQQHWQQASTHLDTLQQTHPTNALYAHYRQRLHTLQTQPPAPDWDGCWVLSEK